MWNKLISELTETMQELEDRTRRQALTINAYQIKEKEDKDKEKNSKNGIPLRIGGVECWYNITVCDNTYFRIELISKTGSRKVAYVNIEEHLKGCKFD